MSSFSIIEEDLNRKNLRILRDQTGRIPEIIADPRHVTQILLNILSNAVKFSNEGSAIEINLTNLSTQEVEVTIADNGIGIPADEIEKVLQPFGQSGDPLTRPHQGTGLGLPLSIALLELNQGRFHISSEAGVGTTVSLTFPQASNQNSVLPDRSG